MSKELELKQALDEKFKGIQDTIETLKSKETVEKEYFDNLEKSIMEKLKEQGETIANLKKGDPKTLKTLSGAIDKYFDEHADEIKNTHKGKVFEFKAVHDMTTGDVSVVGGTPATAHLSPRHFNLANYDWIYDLVSHFETSTRDVYYTELVPEDEGYEVVAEGGKKPKISFKMETKYVTYVKIAAYEELTEESVKDIRRMKSLAKEYLFKKHKIKKAREILDFAISQASSFSAGVFANAITAPNFMDTINTAAASIMLKENYQDDDEAYVNVVLVSVKDYISKIVTAKDSQGRALFPNSTFRNEVNLGGLLIKPHKNIPVGKIFMADFSKLHVSTYEKYSVRIGWINENFIHNKFIILGESKYHRFIKEQDKKAFMIDDYTTIKTAITA